MAKAALSVRRRNGPAGCSGCFGYLLGFLFVSAFFAAGVLILWSSFLDPTIQIVRAQSWVETPCTILSSKVVGNETYQIEVEYEYVVNGIKHTGKRYSFADLSTSGRDRKQKVVDRYPPGKQTVCYVNPTDPTESVIHRGFVLSMCWGLFSLPFLAVGVGGYAGMLLSRKKIALKQRTDELFALMPESSAARPSSPRLITVSNSDYDDEDLEDEPGPVTLKPETSRLGAFIAMGLFALIWNGILSIFLFERLEHWQQGDWSWFPEIILIPFMLVGLLLLVGVFHIFLSLFNPAPLLTLSHRRIPLGGTALLIWHFEGATSSLRSLKLTLQGIEEARYTRGTNTYTDQNTFFKEVIFETNDPSEVVHGKTEIVIPSDSMHSFTAPRNKIKWRLVMQGEIAYWPDVHSTFPITVVPHE